MASENQAPERIYLQWSGDGDPDDPRPPEEGEVTWARESVFPGDVEYVRADVALAQAAAWEARAKGLVKVLREHRDGCPECSGIDEPCPWCRHANGALSAPRPEPGRVLEVVRAAVRCLREIEEDDAPAFGMSAQEFADTMLGECPEGDLLRALLRLTPEERQALGERE